LTAATNATESAASVSGASSNQPLSEAVLKSPAEPVEQRWNWHVQNTDIVQWSPAFPAQYSGPNSFLNSGQVAETVSLDLYAGVRLWRGAEAHVDALMWQGFGLSKTLGIEGFPNGEAFRLGTWVPNATFARSDQRPYPGAP
jgi:high affinity Mn2+ porin